MPVTFDTYKTDGTTATIEKGDKITAIDGVNYDLWVNDIQPTARQPKMGGIKHWQSQDVSVTITPFSQINASTLAIEYSTAITVKGQVVFKDTEKRSSKRGSDTPVSNGWIEFKNAGAQKNRLFRAYFTDELGGLIFANQFTVKFYKYTRANATAGMGVAGTRSSVSGYPVTLSVKFVDINLEYQYQNSPIAKIGSAKVIIQRTISQADLEADNTYFTIKVGSAGTEQEYSIVPGGIKPLQTHHWEIMLEIKRQ